MAKVISLLTDEEDDALDLEDTVAPTNVVPVQPTGTILLIDESDIF
jgi:hypothetical protein